jgi:hypothetical protein
MSNKSYHPSNVAAQPFPAWRVILLARLAKLLGVQFKIDGMPYGAEYRPELWGEPKGITESARENALAAGCYPR